MIDSAYAGTTIGFTTPEAGFARSRPAPTFERLPMDQFEVWDDEGGGPRMLLEREPRRDGVAHYLVRRVFG